MAVVKWEKRGEVAVLEIVRPEVKNALNMEVFRELERALLELKGDDGVKALVVTGAGDSFVAGADINELLAMDLKGGFEASRYQQSVFDRLEKLGKPSVAAIRGYCLGGGLELALACTFRIASKGARLGFPELGLGIIPAFGGVERLIRTVGFARALELVLFQRIVDGQEAEAMGLVNLAVEDGEVMEKAMEWAEGLSRLSPFGVRLALELFYRAQGGGLEEDLSLESALAALAVSSPEAKERLKAFLERRKKG